MEQIKHSTQENELKKRAINFNNYKNELLDMKKTVAQAIESLDPTKEGDKIEAAKERLSTIDLMILEVEKEELRCDKKSYISTKEKELKASNCSSFLPTTPKLFCQKASVRMSSSKCF